MYKDIGKRIMALLLSVCMIAGMVDLSGFTVHAEDVVRIAEVEVTDTDITYDGTQKKPNIVVKDYSGNIIDSGYFVDYGENIHVNTGGTVTVTGDGVTCVGTANTTFTIQAKDFSSSANVTVVEPMKYVQGSGINILPEQMLVEDAGNALNSGTDYTYALSDNNMGTDDPNPKTVTVTVTGIGDYTGTATGSYQITRIEGEKFQLQDTGSVSSWVMVYNGKTQELPQTQLGNLKVTYDGITDIKPEEYEFRYRNTDRASRGDTKAQVYALGKGKRFGQLESNPIEFTVRKNLTAAGGVYDVSKQIQADPIPAKPYQGPAKPVELTADDIKLYDPDYGREKPLVLGEDYTIGSYTRPTTANGQGKASVTINGIGGYVGSMKLEFEIYSPTLASIGVKAEGTFVYDRESKKNKVNVVVGDGATYTEGIDYTLEYSTRTNHTDAGEHSITVRSTGTGKIQAGSTAEVKYTIAKRSIEPNNDVTVSDVADSYAYNGTAHKPTPAVSYKGQNLSASEVEYSYENNINAGTEAKVIVTGKGNFTGSVTKQFTISAMPILDDNIIVTNFDDTRKYEGKPIEQSSINVSLKQGSVSKPLTRGRDYEIGYENNLNVGVATMKINGIGNYSGTVSREFEITKRNITDGTSIRVSSPVIYTGEVIVPPVTITLGTVTLTEDKDFTLESVGNPINAQKQAEVRIIGKDNFKGETTGKFDIEARSIDSEYLTVTATGISLEDENFSEISNANLNEIFYKFEEKEGGVVTKDLKISYNGDGVSYNFQESDYTIVHNNNNKPGTATLRITGVVNWKGTKDLEYRIRGDLSDFDTTAPLTEIITHPQTYTGSPVKPVDTEVIFNGNKLTHEKDYTIENYTTINVTTVATGKATADIIGTGDYYNKANVEFDIVPLNLSTDDLEKNEYNIALPAGITGIAGTYIYSGLPIEPKPEITHFGKTLTSDTDYTVEYNTNADTGAGIKVGPQKLKVKGSPDNYTGEKEEEFTIEAYDFEAAYAEGKVEITGVEDSVVLDWVKDREKYADKYTEADSPVMKEDSDEIIWPGLQVSYTAVDMEGQPQSSKDLALDTDYTVKYEKNNTIGTATITVTGKGNFKGTIKKEFRIVGDLSGDYVSMELNNGERWEYSPKDAKGNPTNTPEPEVYYTVTFSTGITQKLSLIKGEDYGVRYENYTDATAAPEGINSTKDGSSPAKAVIYGIDSPGTSSDNDQEGLNGNYCGEREEKFQIYQRDLSKAKENENDMRLDGVDEEGYPYTGEAIEPDMQIYCKEQLLNKLDSAAAEGTAYDYKVKADNNVNVYTWQDDIKGGTRLMPTLTVTASRNADEAYDGNYYGEFTKEFKINPRQITEDTVDKFVKIKNDRIAPPGGLNGSTGYLGEENAETGFWECDYIRDYITFDSLVEEGKSALTVVWCEEEGGTETKLIEGQDFAVGYEHNARIGDATVYIRALEEEYCNYEGRYDKIFKIMATIEDVNNNPPEYMTLKYDHDVYYGVDPVYPDLIFEDRSGMQCEGDPEPKILKEGEDFEIVTLENQGNATETSKNNTGIGKEDDVEEFRPTVVVRGIDCYKGVIKRYYNIIKKNFSDPESGITLVFGGDVINDDYNENAYVYNGAAMEPPFEIYNNDFKKMGTEGYTPNAANRKLTKDKDYKIVEWKNNDKLSEGETKASVTVEGIGENYEGQATFYFSIIPQPISGAGVKVDFEKNQIFDRTAKEPELTITFDGNTLTEGTDYTVAYENNINVSTAVEEEEKKPAVVLNGIGGFGGTSRITFNILPEDIGNEEDIEATGRAIYKEGEEVVPEFQVQAKDGTKLELDVDYTVDPYTGETGINVSGVATIRGIGNYTGSREVAFRMYPPEGDFRIEEIEPQEFRNAPIKPEVKVFLDVDEELSIQLIEGTDYVLEYDNIINAGVDTAVVIAKGLGYFAEQNKQAAARFTITPKSIGSEGLIDSAMEMGAIEPQWYGGRPIVPGVELKFQPTLKEGEETNNPVILIPNTDYRVTAVNNTMVGEATATITGIGNYTGTIETKFRIHGNMNLVDVAPIPTQEYTGSPVTPVPQVSIGGKAMVEGTDYRVEYSNNVDRGTASITITGTEDWYFGTKVVKFDIARELSAETSVRGVASVYTYTGAAITPPVRVEDDGNLLVSGVDYDIAYSENINAGTAVITITGKGKYTGGTTASFKISPQQLGRAKISPVSDQIFNGKEQNPPITVTSGSTTLQSGKDYSVVYVNSATPGMASVIVKGEGNYTGTQTINYSIKVPEVTGVKVSKYTNKSVTISWTKNDVVSGYEIYNSKNRRAARVNKPTTTKGTVSKLSAGTSQTFRVRAYVNKDGQYYYGPFTSVKAVTAPNSTKISSLKSTKKKQVTVKWKKVKGATQYQVYRSTSKKGKYKKLATTKKTSYTDKKATGGKKYYYKIRVCKKINKKNYYSSYSAVKSVKAKK